MSSDQHVVSASNPDSFDGQSHLPQASRRLDVMARIFVTVAFVEAGTWAALLVGMYIKYVPQTTDLGVQIAGTLHGYAFLIYVAVTVTAAIRFRWRWGTILIALLAAIPPLTTIAVE